MEGKAKVNETRYSEEEAAAKIGIHRITLVRWRHRGLIGFYRIGPRVYYSDSHLNEFLARCERKAKGVADRKREAVCA